jgi:methyl-accepting chemotaxis protein
MKLGTKINLMLLMSMLTVIVLLSSLSYLLSYNMLVGSFGKRAEEIAATASESINVQEFQSYKTEEDTQKSSYKQVRDKLVDIRKMSGSKYIYVMRKNDKGQYEYIIDGSEEPANFGDVEEFYPEYEGVYKGQATRSNRIDIGEYGVVTSAYYPLKAGNSVVGFIGVDYDLEQGYREFEKLGRIILIVSVLISIFAVFIGSLFSKRLVKPLIQMNRVAENVSKYDLTVNNIAIENKDEIGALAEAVNIMVSNMIRMIASIKTSTEIINNKISSFTKIAANTNIAVEDVVKSMNEIAAATTKQATEISIQTEDINRLTGSIEAVSGGINDITGIVQDTENLNKKGITTVNSLVSRWQDSTNSRNEIGIVIHEVDENSKEIQAIVDTINNISAQTNLLALNASIEAARAGEHGRGFSIVAEEIRKLAEQSAQATKGIRSLVEEIQDTAQKAVTAMNVLKETDEEQSKIIKDTEKIFFQFSDNINTLLKQLDEVRMENSLMSSNKEKMIGSVQYILELTEQNNAYIEETTAASEEVFSTVSDFEEQVEDMNKLSQSLNNEVLKFKI